MNEEITLPLWLPIGLLVICMVFAAMAFSCAEGTVHMAGRLQELRWLLRRREREIRRLREHARLCAWRPPPVPEPVRVPWPDPDPGDLVAVDPSMHPLSSFGTWPDLPPAEPTRPVVLALPLTEKLEIVGAPA